MAKSYQQPLGAPKLILVVLICVIAGVLMALAFPRANVHWLAWFALSPLLFFSFHLNTRQALACAAAFGFAFFADLLYWIGVFGRFPVIALAVFQGLFVVAFVAVARLFGNRLGPWGRLLLLPSLWVAFEWLRSLGMFGFTWGDLGYSQYKYLPVVQVASLTGVWGVSFLIALSNSALANVAIARGRLRESFPAWLQLLAVVCLMVGTLAFGFHAVGQSPGGSGEPLKVAVVQGAIDQNAERDKAYHDYFWNTYETLTMEAARESPDMIVWPETVVPGVLGVDGYAQVLVSRIADRTGAKLIVGGWDENEHGGALNTAFLVLPDAGVVGRYAKVHLVPFGEFVPRVLRRALPFLDQYNVNPHDVFPGPEYNLLDAVGYDVGVAICFESIFPDISRRLTDSGADLLCVITNDAWFKRTSAAEQHMAKSVFRAVENRRYVLRGATTGISCIIDPNGRILTQSDLFQPAVLHAEVHPIESRTFYTRHGDWFVYTCLVAVAVLAVVNATRRRSRSAR